MRLILTLCAMLCLSACAHDRPIVTTPPVRCSKLIPDEWRNGVGGVPVPDTKGLDALGREKAWAGAYVASEGQVEKADGRTADTIGIYERCEALFNEARGG